jgi:thioester reductase-like protein
MSTGTAASPPPERDGSRATSRRRQSVLMLGDAVLPPDVRPQAPPNARPRVALLTGATGFLGRYAARALLAATDLRLVCLVRAGDDRLARVRLLDALARVGVSDPVLLDRVTAVSGDVAEPALGLDRRTFDALAAQVDLVYHCAAEVNWARSYRQLRAVNVLGALEVVRFACAARAKPLVFVSTIAVCFAQGGSGPVDEDTDMLPHVEAMPLGYAQSKCVAEHLLRQAAARGLPVTILRPALISGDSRTGDVNLDDLIAALVEGCAAAGAAIDVDWLLDCVPVDFVADVLARVPAPPAPGARVLHLIHDGARHWREVVLWMNLYGYPVKLVPTREWLDSAFVRGSAAGTRLYGYRRFFQGTLTGDARPRPFEAYLEPHQRRIEHHRTQTLLEALGVATPPLDAPLLHRYFEHYRGAGLLPSSVLPGDASPAAAIAAADFEALLRRRTRVPALRVVEVRPLPFASANGILNEISSVRLGTRVGLQRYTLAVEQPGRHAPLRFDTLVKTKATDEVLQSLTVSLAAVCDARLGELFDRHRHGLGLARSHERELALYELRDPRLRRYTPRCFGTLRNSPAGLWTVVLEHVREVDTHDVSAGIGSWSPARLAAVVDGLASIQSVGCGRRARLSASGWLAPERSTEQMLAMAPLWQALVAYASDRFGQWCPPLPALQQALVGTLGDWWPRLLALPHTLIHNDFNPRNVALRATREGLRLCAFDWELAAFGLPQRDLAEFLCFVAGERAGDAHAIGALVERHRLALAAAAGVTLDPAEWRAGFALALRQFLVTRLPMYALIQRFRPQRFLPGVVQGAARLCEVTRSWGAGAGLRPA